jgi:hypothetical protein
MAAPLDEPRVPQGSNKNIPSASNTEYPHLPQELAAADEGCGVLELPTDNVCPLIQAQGQVAVAADPLRKCGSVGGAEGMDTRNMYA